MERRQILIFICLMIVNIDLFAQDNNVQIIDTIGKGKTILFNVTGIVDTTKANISGIIMDCKNNSLVGGTVIKFYNVKTGISMDFCCTDSLGGFRLWIDNGYYNIKINALSYYDYEINNILLGSGHMIDSKFCLSQKPDMKFDKPIIMDKCYQKIDKNKK